jgi:hypothetical protein
MNCVAIYLQMQMYLFSGDDYWISFKMLLLICLLIKLVGVCSRVVRTFPPPGLGPSRTQSLYLHMFTSSTQLVYQRLSGVWIASGHAPKTPLLVVF